MALLLRLTNIKIRKTNYFNRLILLKRMKKERKKLIFFLSSFFLAKENIGKKKKERNYLYPIEILSVRMEK